MINETNYPCRSCEYEEDNLCSHCGYLFIEEQYNSLLTGEYWGVDESDNQVWVLNSALYCVSEVEKEEDIGPDWLKVKNVVVGEAKGKPDKYYLVSKNYTPLLLVTLFYVLHQPPYSPEYSLRHNHLLLKRFQDFYFIDLLTFEQKAFSPTENKGFSYIDGFY